MFWRWVVIRELIREGGPAAELSSMYLHFSTTDTAMVYDAYASLYRPLPDTRGVQRLERRGHERR